MDKKKSFMDVFNEAQQIIQAPCCSFPFGAASNRVPSRSRSVADLLEDGGGGLCTEALCVCVCWHLVTEATRSLAPIHGPHQDWHLLMTSSVRPAVCC